MERLTLADLDLDFDVERRAVAEVKQLVAERNTLRRASPTPACTARLEAIVNRLKELQPLITKATFDRLVIVPVLPGGSLDSTPIQAIPISAIPPSPTPLQMAALPSYGAFKALKTRYRKHSTAWTRFNNNFTHYRRRHHKDVPLDQCWKYYTKHICRIHSQGGKGRRTDIAAQCRERQGRTAD